MVYFLLFIYLFLVMNCGIASSNDEVKFDIKGFIRVYKDGRTERFSGTDMVTAPAVDKLTGVPYKDVVIVPETDVLARLFLPPKINTLSSQKLPLLIYIHGGGFCLETPFNTMYHNYVSSLVVKANVVAVSIHYRRAPEHPIPLAYDDGLEVLKWVASHYKGNGSETWLNKYADLNRIFVVGDSAGAVIAHHAVVRMAETQLKEEGVNFVGLGLMHPCFHEEKEGKFDEKWLLACPTTSGWFDPMIYPTTENLKKIPCERVLVFVAGNDQLRGGGLFYYETLGKSGWKGERDLMETKGEGHVFFLQKPTSEKAMAIMTRLVSFVNQESGTKIISLNNRL